MGEQIFRGQGIIRVVRIDGNISWTNVPFYHFVRLAGKHVIRDGVMFAGGHTAKKIEVEFVDHQNPEEELTFFYEEV